MEPEYKAPYDDSPRGRQGYWTEQLALARVDFTKFHEKSKKVVDRFIDESATSDPTMANNRLNLFHANVVTMRAMLYGQLPKVEVSRKFADFEDDVSRVASQILLRMLNQDVQDPSQDWPTIMRNVLEDRLVPGLGTARVAYKFKSEKVMTPAQVGPDGIELAPAIEEEKITDEWVETKYTYWKDIVWSPARTYDEVKWVAYRAYMGKEECKERFGEDKQIPYNTKGAVEVDGRGSVATEEQAEIWEIWCKKSHKVYWVAEGCAEILDEKDDPLELEQFFPSPPPMAANTTTSKFIPKADYTIAQDLYRAIDVLEERIEILTRSCKLVGVYDKTAEGLQNMLVPGLEGKMIPVDNWALFAERGGMKGVVDWLPIEQIVNVIDKLTEKQQQKIQQLYELTGMSDIMRGAQTQAYATAAEQKIKAQFASMRVQALQDEFARFCSNLQELKAEIISKHFQPQTIAMQSNIMNTPDRDFAQPAIELIKNFDISRWRIQVRPESMALADYAQLKADRSEYIMAISQFMQSAAPLLTLKPEVAPTLMELLKWGLAGFKGANEIEGVMDRAIKQATEAGKQPPKPSPEEQKAKMDMQIKQQEAQMKMQGEQQRLQGDMQKMQMELQIKQAEFALEKEKMQMEMQLEREKFGMEMQMLQAKMSLQAETLKMKQSEQAAQFTFNTAEREHENKMQEAQHERDEAAAGEKDED